MPDFLRLTNRQLISIVETGEYLRYDLNTLRYFIGTLDLRLSERKHHG